MPGLETLQWRPEQILTHVGWRTLPSTVIRHPDEPEFEVKLIVVDALFPDLNRGWKRPLSELTGWAWHHDAVAFSGSDANFNGHRTDEEFRRLQAIYDYHIAQKWNGLGYHFVAGLERRVYVSRVDVIDTHRAHVSGGPSEGGPNWNRQLLGFCHMGHYSDSALPDGTIVARQADRPPPDAIKAADTTMRVVTTLLNRRMTLRPHKYYQQKECPGDWTTVGSWDGFAFQPGAVAPPVPAPPAPPQEIAPGVYLESPSLVPTGKNASTGRWGYELHQRFEVLTP